MSHFSLATLKFPARLICLLAFTAGAISPSWAAEEDVWPSLQSAIFGDRVPVEGSEGVVLEAPVRAEDAALVPITMTVPAALASSVTKLTLIIDKNPAPVAAEFVFGPAAGSGDRIIQTRVRVDMYSNIRAVAETATGKLYMSTRFVKAAGGCSAPALKDTDAALVEAGKMQIKTLPQEASAGVTEGQIKIRHPQYSGLQLNQATGYYIPAKFLRTIEVLRGTELVFRVEGGISLSEDPNIRFTYARGAGEPLAVNATDTDGKVFSGRGEAKGS